MSEWKTENIYKIVSASISLVYGLGAWIITVLYGEGYGRYFEIPVVTALTYGLYLFVKNLWFGTQQRKDKWGTIVLHNPIYLLLMPSFETQINALSTLLLLPYAYEHLTGWDWGWKRILVTVLLPLTILIPFIINLKFALPADIIPVVNLARRGKLVSLLSGAIIGIGFGLVINFLNRKTDTNGKPSNTWRNVAIGIATLTTVMFFAYLFHSAAPKST